ncbi:MAG: Ig-like domain-containing protein [Thermodesulfobacteriota bacterium]
MKDYSGNMKTLTLTIQFTFLALYLCLSPISADEGKNSIKPLKVEIVSLREGEVVSGKITIQALVNHPEKVSLVEFYFQEPGAQDRYSWIAHSPPYFWGGEGQKLDTTLFNDGPASAVAFCLPKDSRLPVKQSRIHLIIDNGKPKVKILSPKDSATVSGNVPIRVDANDPKGIHKEAGIVAVYIYVDGGLLQRLPKPPFVATLSTCLLAPGLHSIRVVAEDTEGLISADSIMVNVERGGSALGIKNR